MVKTPPTVQETWVQSLGQKDPLEKGMAATPVFLPGEFHGQRSLAEYSPWCCRVGHDCTTNTFTFHIFQIQTASANQTVHSDY